MGAFRRIFHISNKNSSQTGIWGKAGSLIVDAACVVPVFVLAMAALLSLIRLAGEEETLYRNMVCGAEAKCEAYAVGSAAKDVFTDIASFSAFQNCDDQGIVHESGTTSKGKILIAYRPFIGERKENGIYDLTPVIIFPKYGERYHSADCSYVRRAESERYIVTTRGYAESSGLYTPCKVCGGG